MYKNFGIADAVSDFCLEVEASLKDRFEKLDEVAEYNQMKVLAAMQKHRVSAECFNGTTGYGYNDLGRDTLEEVYATCFQRRSRTGTSADHLWDTCAGIGTDVKCPSG